MALTGMTLFCAVSGGIADATQPSSDRTSNTGTDPGALFKTDRPSTHPAIPLISEALKALGAGDRATAMRYLEQALPLAKPAPE